MRAAAPSPLLDRLTLPIEAAQEPLRHLGQAALVASIGRELERVLRTRSVRASLAVAPATPLTVLDYGLPDTCGLAPSDEEGKARLVRAIEATIAAFEPRLAAARVTLEVDTSEPGRMLALVLADLRAMPKGAAAVRFRIALDHRPIGHADG